MFGIICENDFMTDGVAEPVALLVMLISKVVDVFESMLLMRVTTVACVTAQMIFFGEKNRKQVLQLIR